MTITRVAVLGLAAAITLRVVGVPRVDLHGPLHYLGIMDPLCGGTRAMFLLTSGHPAAAAHYNPIVFPFAAVVLAQLARAAIERATGRRFRLSPSPAVRRVLITIGVAALVALEIRQQLHADLLTRSWP
ncbi:hypothetical protein JOF29_000066 [Kribbella aluminosa]|uniref:DUF2752 domain-containing protein n=1 Tax=Kribbella aluminosa TaxID=416017 RepID=A0ABS4UBK3_9ACTN|nr:DUF2752 domain-containing protein [Kribbella aluminosa]MBP2348983.1 hypothetical protein [Kribbella aluminosa]